MARYKPYDLKQGRWIALSFADQILPGSFEHTLNELIEEEDLDLSVFDERYRNDETGSRAYDPKVLLKIVLYVRVTGHRDHRFRDRDHSFRHHDRGRFRDRDQAFRHGDHSFRDHDQPFRDRDH